MRDDGGPDGWLALATGAGSTTLTIVDLRNGATRTIPFVVGPHSLDHLRWAPDNRHLMFEKSWEGSQVGVIDPVAATSGDDTRWLDGGASTGCWLDDHTVAMNGWPTPYVNESNVPLIGPVVTLDLTTGARRELSSQGAGTSLACRPGAAVFTATFSSQMALSVEPASGAPAGQPEYGYLRVLDI